MPHRLPTTPPQQPPPPHLHPEIPHPQPTPRHTPPPHTTNKLTAELSQHPHFDRITIQTTRNLTNITIQTTKELHYGNSGKPVPLTGTRLLLITLTTSRTHNTPPYTYQGPRLTTTHHMTKIKGFALTDITNNTISFGAAFTTNPSHRIIRHHPPTTLTIDIIH